MAMEMEIACEFADTDRTDEVGWRKREGNDQNLHVGFAAAERIRGASATGSIDGKRSRSRVSRCTTADFDLGSIVGRRSRSQFRQAPTFLVPRMTTER